jgi:hypothetical protein
MKDEDDMNGNIDHKCEIIKHIYYRTHHVSFVITNTFHGCHFCNFM